MNVSRRFPAVRCAFRAARRLLPTAASACALLPLKTGSLSASVPTPYPLVVQTGTPAEQSLLVKNAGSTSQGGFRHADAGQFWIYGLPVAPGAHCRLALTLDTAEDSLPPVATVLGADNKPLTLHTEMGPNGAMAVFWTVPNKWAIGSRMSVLLSAKTGAANVKILQLTQSLPDANGDGVPDAVAQMLLAGLPSGTRLAAVRPPSQPFTATACSRPVSPALDVLTDAIFTNAADTGFVSDWKARGYAVWAFASAGKDKAFAAAHPNDMQIMRSGKPVTAGDAVFAAASPAVLTADRTLVETLLGAGSDGFCFQEPEYGANAGYEPVFKQAWQTEYKTPWLEPASSLDARYKTARLMAGSVTARVQAAMQATLQRKPGARRMTALHSALYAPQAEVVSPLARLSGLNEVTDVFGDVGTDTASLTARYGGLRQERLFARAYLEYSSVFHAARGANKRVWFVTDPHSDPAAPTSAEARRDYEQTLIAALMLGDVNAYQLALPPDALTSSLAPDEVTRLHSILAALEDMHNQTGLSGNADKDDDIGVLIGDSAQWQRGEPNSSDLDGLFGLTLPLLQRGVPVQVLALDRAAEPGYLNGFKTLLVSYDFQKPAGARTQQALAEWVRRGGSLIYVGGTDAYNSVSDSWWRQAGLSAPQLDLWTQLGLAPGLPATRMAASEDATRYTPVLKAASVERSQANRRAYPLDLTPYVGQTGSVAVRVSALNSNNNGGSDPNNAPNVLVSSGELTVGGKVAASFTAGSEIENRFLVFDNNSQFTGRERTAEGSASWTYQFDNLPRNAPVMLTLDMANSFVVSVAPSRPDFGHTLLNTGTNATLAKAFPRLRIGAAYPATLYQEVPQPSALYTLRAGGAPIWMQNVGRGLVVNVGVASGFFSASERSAGLLRALTRFAKQRAGGTYREPGFLRLRRGRYIVVHTFAEPLTVEGRTIDVLSPSLNVGEDRTIAPNSSALLYDLGEGDAAPHVGFVSGRLQARVETSASTGFFVRGPARTTGMARLHRGSRRLTGARGTDWLGRPIPVQAQEEGGTLLLRYPNDPDGVIIRVGWQ